MKNYIEKILTISTRQARVIEKIELPSLRKRVMSSNLVKKVSEADSSTLSIKLHNKAVHGRCLLKDLSEGKFVVVTYWDIQKGDELLFHIGSMLWNDNKKGSHLTYSYVTQKNLCVIESHINLQWEVTEVYFASWLRNYLTTIPEFQNHIDNMRNYFEKLPQEKMSMLEKIWIGAEIAESASVIWKILRNEF